MSKKGWSNESPTDDPPVETPVEETPKVTEVEFHQQRADKLHNLLSTIRHHGHLPDSLVPHVDAALEGPTAS